jgi:hypothetical protein
LKGPATAEVVRIMQWRKFPPFNCLDRFLGIPDRLLDEHRLTRSSGRYNRAPMHAVETHNVFGYRLIGSMPIRS